MALLQPSAVQAQEKTAFQIAAPWNEVYDVRSDVAIVYGINDAGGAFEKRVKGWRDKGYQVHFMTGIAWGQYQDYFKGAFDGKPHFDEGQVQQNGDTIWHGKDVPYIVPSENYLRYIKTHLKRAIDAGVTAIHLEEPEFWARAGYSTAFKKEWQQYYGSAWRPQHESPEATYLSSKLKYHLYLRTLQEAFSYVKTYARSQGKVVRCYVPTHSLLNYASWRIVSPEASLASLKDMDGYIAQVWTGTSREPVYYNGVKKERVFENAFLEYGSMVSMTAPAGKKMFFLTDPIEDWPRTWDDYKKNYQATFTAQLLYPTVANYEVMPWPNRIYQGRFKLENDSVRQPISKAYATQMQVMVNALNTMPLSSNKISGSHGIGVLVSNSMMFQRFPTHAGYEDPQLSNFYGMALPLLKKGIPVETVHMENLEQAHVLKDIRVLIMSYANMKPLSQQYHQVLNRWVRSGGILLYYGRDNDPFQSVSEWWNSNGLSYKTPSEDLFRLFHFSEGQPGFVKTGNGWVVVTRMDPKELVLEPGRDTAFLALVKKAYARSGAGTLEEKNHFILKRGPYIIAAALDENDDKKPLLLKGPLVDLFDPELPVLTQKELQPGQQAFLYDLKTIKNKNPLILAAAGRAYEERYRQGLYTFLLKSPTGTMNAMRIYLPASPKTITLTRDGTPARLIKNDWDAASNTLLLQFENDSRGIQARIQL
ncbi:hypothetical protein [Niabella pedocola]|uniref:hypothetical protein n=1 Tax=Niabella pedocola TaxID=1752077 RepID=UPI00374C9B6B